MAIVEGAPAKINLALHVRRRRDDGYHELETLFTFARHGDVLSIERADRWSFKIIGPFALKLRAGSTGTTAFPRAATPGVGGGAGKHGSEWADNLVTRAATGFVEAFPITPPHVITLEKRLPIASGIGGGSADAAATLRALARTVGVSLEDPRLFAVARSLGADVPACLYSRTVEGSGIGEVLRPIDGLPGTPLLLVTPPVAISTAAVFAAWDGIDRGPLPAGDLLERARAGRNDLAAPAREIAPVIAEVEEMFATAPGVLLARMSGSGATCFALFETVAARHLAMQRALARSWWTLASILG